MAGGIQHTSSRGRGRMRRRPMAEINVTPFVDVMLVLLIVFMVTAPLLTVGVPVDLPKTKAPALGQDREPLSITVRRDGAIFLQKEPVLEAALVDKLKAKGVAQDFSFVVKQRGMFSYTGLTSAQVDVLRNEFGIYAVGTGRICLAALNSKNIDAVVDAIAAVLKA